MSQEEVEGTLPIFRHERSMVGLNRVRKMERTGPNRFIGQAAETLAKRAFLLNADCGGCLSFAVGAWGIVAAKTLKLHLAEGENLRKS